MIRLQTDGISAQMARDRLEGEGIPAEVVADTDGRLGLGITGTPLAFSIVVPSDREEDARRLLAGGPRSGGPRKRSRREARERRRR